MTKKLWILCALILVGCGNGKTLSTTELPAKVHTFKSNNQTWQITTPGDWQILPAETQVPFMAQKGSQNIAILERDLTTTDPAEQIISSAENQFFAFTLNERSDTTWKFTGQPGPTNTPRTFWQEIKTIANTRNFLLGSCSQIDESPNGSQCEAILKSWGMVEVE